MLGPLRKEFEPSAKTMIRIAKSNSGPRLIRKSVKVWRLRFPGLALFRTCIALFDI